MNEAIIKPRPPTGLLSLLLATLFLSACGGGTSADSASVPGAPAIGSIAAGDGSASIVFSAPAVAGSSAISSYTASCVSSANTRTASGTASPLTVSNLSNGISYSCSVAATNSAGTGASSSSVVVTPAATSGVTGTTYPVVGTNQTLHYDNSKTISAPSAGQAFYGQNANYPGNAPKYKDNGDGTVSDLVTGLMWQKTTDKNGDGVINYSDKMTYAEAVAHVATVKTGGYADWRLPTIKEMYSLIMFSGADVGSMTSAAGALPFIDTKYFSFGYGDTGVGERVIDAQYATSTLYVSTVMSGTQAMFGVNFADGRIKGYPTDPSLGANAGVKTKYYVQLVRGNSAYGKNQFADNGDGTITDKATGLMWMKNDSGKGLNWQDALSYAATLTYAGHNDWRLPDAKELQSIVDYTRSPATTNSAAIDPLFGTSQIIDEAGAADYPYFWSSTTHAAGSAQQGQDAAYVCFGTCMGYMTNQWIDVHGAGAQRSDPKAGDASQFPNGHGPQGDAIRIKNYVRLVRTAK